VPDEGAAYNRPQRPAAQPSAGGEQGETAITQPSASPPPSGEDEKVTQTLKERKLQLKRYEVQRLEEEGLMTHVLQILDPETAKIWLSGFISAKPLNCPLPHQGAWIEAIISAVQRNSLPVCKEILGLVACIVSIESGFQADPPAADRSRGEDMAKIFERAEKELFHKFGGVLSVPPVPQLYELYREKYLPRLLACKTEGDLEGVATLIVEDLKKDSTCLPDFIKKIVYEEIDGLKNIVRTKGSMQLNFLRARQVMQERGDPLNDEDLTAYMYTVTGGVDVGVAALRPMFVQYAARYAIPGDLSWLFFVGMDYHYGPFSSRNMMEQIRIRDLSERKIAIDGDFLHYDKKGRPLEKESETLRAVASIFPSIPKSELFKALLLEKDPHYAYTEIHAAIGAGHRERFGDTPFAVIGDLWLGQDAQIKHGTAWKTRSYLKKLDYYLNSIPWDQP
jgi:hypothetical protein